MGNEFCLEPTESEVQEGYPGKMSNTQFKKQDWHRYQGQWCKLRVTQMKMILKAW